MTRGILITADTSVKWVKSYCLGTKIFQNKRQEGREGGKEIRDGDERRGGEGKGWEGREDRQ